MKRIIATFLLTLGLLGSMAAVATPASAEPFEIGANIGGDTDTIGQGLCIRVNVTLFGTRIGTGPDPICLT